jgi:hypothetical protein
MILQMGREANYSRWITRLEAREWLKTTGKEWANAIGMANAFEQWERLGFPKPVSADNFI